MLENASLPVTATFLSLCALILFVKTGWVGVYRGKTNILRGDGGDPILFKRSRVHGNFAETAPFAIASVGLGEMMGLSANLLWLAVASFFFGRILHYIWYDHKLRGVAMTFVNGPAVLIGVWMLFQIWG